MITGYINESGNYRLEELGLVHVNVRTDARSVRARWKMGMLHVSAPRGIEAQRLLDILRGFGDSLQQRKPDAPYAIGSTINFHDFSVDIASQSRAPRNMLMRIQGNRCIIEVGAAWDMAQPNTIRQITKFICRMAQSIAPGIIMPQARQVAQRIGKHPLLWTISNGHRTLGHCNAKGEIALSYALLFYPPHLREYVICHELAHLSELNHSPRFHEICNAYCGGREAELEAELRANPSPLAH